MGLENAWNDITPDDERTLIGKKRPPLIKTTQPTELEAAEVAAMRNIDYLEGYDSSGVTVGPIPECYEVFHYNLGAKEIEGDDWNHQVGMTQKSEQRDPVTGADEPSDAREVFETARRTKREQVIINVDSDGRQIPVSNKDKKTGVQVMWYDCTVSPAVFKLIEVDIV